VDGAPRWKGTTAEAFELFVVCTTTLVAAIVVPLTVPSTRTVWPFLTVVEALVTVTFWPADVVSVKLDWDTLPTVPTVPPAAGPERAFDAPPPPPPKPGRPAGAAEVVVVAAALVPVLAVALTMP
jgi:hypothetical protein